MQRRWGGGQKKKEEEKDRGIARSIREKKRGRGGDENGKGGFPQGPAVSAKQCCGAQAMSI